MRSINLSLDIWASSLGGMGFRLARFSTTARSTGYAGFFDHKIQLPDPTEVSQIYQEASTKKQMQPIRSLRKHGKIPKKTKRSKKREDPISAEKILEWEMSNFLAEMKAAGHPFLKTYPEIAISNEPELVAEFWRSDTAPETAELEVTVTGFSASSACGFALAEYRGRLIVLYIPLALKDEIVRVKLDRIYSTYAEATVLEVVKPSPERDDSLSQCQYFGKCSGCQLQMLPQEIQLEWKRRQISSAVSIFFPNDSQLPEIGATIASPRTYGYRTKLTPHFNGPSRRGEAPRETKIGFNGLGRDSARLIDLERCAIASDVINENLPAERQGVKDGLHNWPRGGTLLMRESVGENGAKMNVSQERATVREIVNGKIFEFPAFSFFQNNNSIIPRVLDHLTENFYITQAGVQHKPRYLIDTYCGSGLFGISLSGLVDKMIGIEIDSSSLRAAATNAALNNLTNCEFVEGSADEIFSSSILSREIIASDACVIMDPSRKGSNAVYLDQLAAFQPGLIYYISCNVYSQARDLHYFLTQTENGAGYSVRHINGFDFFPQTKHVESVAILELKD